MDVIEKLEAEEERRRQVATCTEDVRSAALADGNSMRSDIRPEDWPVTIIGCVRGVTGWFTAGYDARKRTIVPLPGQALDVGSARIRPRTDKTNTTNETNTAEGRKP